MLPPGGQGGDGEAALDPYAPPGNRLAESRHREAFALQVRPVTLEGRFVRLEPLEVRHASSLAWAASREIFTYHFPPRELSPAGFSEQIRGFAAVPLVAFAIVSKPTGRAVGQTAFLDLQPAHRALEVGLTWIGKRWQGTEVNPESKLLLLTHAFEELDCLRVQLKTDERNAQSQRAIEKLGAVKEGVLRKHMLLPDGFQRATVIYSITDDDWPTVRTGLLARFPG